MHTGKRLLTVFSSVCAIVALKADVVVAPWQTLEVSPDSADTLSERLVVSDGGDVAKTGGGTWTFPVGLLAAPTDVPVTVFDGTLALGFGSAAGSDPGAVRPAVMDIAAIWVSAADSDETHFESASGGGIEKWYDVRETDVSSPLYLRAHTSYTFSENAPERVTTNGYAAVWFGGTGSGRAMNWYKPNGSRFTAKLVKHVFAVHGVLKSYGAIFSPGTDSGEACAFFTPLAYNADYSITHGYWRRDVSIPFIWNGRTWVDGIQIDGLGTLNVAKGFHLLEADTARWTSSYTGAFFSQWKEKAYSGGDFLCEAVAFTNVLSEADRILVGTYLKKKWFGSSAPKINVTLAEDATVAVEETGTFALSGTGTMAKRGNGDFVWRTEDWSALPTISFGGNAKVESGTLTMSSLLPLSVAAGDHVTATTVTEGRRTAVAHDAAANALVKDGADEVVVAEVPSAVKKISVNGGRLTFRTSCQVDAPSATTVHATVPNADFEDFDDSYFTTTTPYVLPTTKTEGWKKVSGNAWIVNWDKWTTGIWGATASGWGFYARPITGDCSIFLNASTKVSTTVTIPEDGTWEFSCLRQCRAANAYLGGYADVTLRNTSSDALVASFGRIWDMDVEKRWKQVSLKTTVAAGTYTLQIQQSGTSAILIDDIEIRRVADPSDWPIPNGTFETATMQTGNDAHKFTSQNTMTGWTFDEPENGTMNPPVGLVSFATTNAYSHGGYYNDSRQPAGGFIELYFRNDGATAQTTFTPPAGTYRLRVEAAHRCDYNGALGASVTIADSAEAQSLGSVSVTSSAMRTVTFPNSFTVDGTQEVALSVTGHPGAADNGIWADDFRLAPVVEVHGELVSNGSFENGITGWSPLTADNGKASKGTYGIYNYANWRDQLGEDELDGRQYLMLWNTAGVCQDLNFPAAGVYRLSFWQHTRLYPRASYGINPVTTWLSKDGITNVIGTTCSVGHTNFVQHVFDFRVPSPGSYSLGLRGTRTNNSMEAMVDGVSVQYLPIVEQGPMLAEDVTLEIDSGASVRLDFDGTNRIETLRLAGRRVSGIVTAETHPDFISGRGAIETLPKGTMISFK